MKTKIISILWWSLTHPVALLTTLAKLGCSLAIIFAIVVSVCEIKIDFIEQGKKALISEIFNAGYSSNSSLTVASLRDFDVNDWEIDPEQEQQLAAATDMHHNFAYSQPIIALLGSQDRFSLSDSTVFNLDKNINSGISYQNFNDKGFALIDSINEYTKAHPELQNDPHYQDLIKAQIAQIYFNSTLLPEHMSADIGLANTITAITEKEAPALEPAPAPASNSRANSNKVALPPEFAHNCQETLPCSEPITEQITEPVLAANDLASNHETHSPYGYQDTDYSNDTTNGYQHNSYQNHNSLYSSLKSSSFTSNSLNGSYNHGYSHSQGSSQHESELKSTARYQNHNLNRNLKSTRDDLYLAQEGKLHHQQSLASTNSSLKGQTYGYSSTHNLQPNQEQKSLSPNSRSSSNYALEPNANLAMSNTPNSALTNHGLMSSDGILEEEEEELVLALPDSKALTPSQAATITTSSASHNHMLSQGHNLSHGHGLNQSHDLSKSQNQGLSHSLSYSNSFEQEPTFAQTQDAYYSQANTNKIASAKAQLCISASKSLGATISASKPTTLTNSSVTSTDPNPFASLSSLASLASANSSSYSGSTLSMDTVATPVSNSSYHHGSQSDSTTLSTSTSSGTGTGSSTLSSSSSSSIYQNPNSKLNNTNSYHNSSNNSHSSTSILSRQNDSSHYAIALAPTMTNNDMSTYHTISTAMVTALSTNTDPAAIRTRTNTATITANTDVSATGTTATEPATTTTVSSTDLAPATTTGTTNATGTKANDSDGLATADTINGIGTAITVTGTDTGSDITGTGTGTAMGTGTGAANSDELDSEVAYLYRLDEELFDEEVERWDLEALEQLDLVIEDPEINLTAQDYQIIDEVMTTIDDLRDSGIAVDLDTVQMLCEHYMPQPYGTILLNNTKHEHLLSLLKSKQAKEQAKLAAVEQKESLATELKDNSQPSKGQDDATLGAISNLATEQAHSLTKANAPTITNYPTKSDAQPSLGHSVFSVTNLVADDYIASMALETNTLYASLNTKMGANLGAPYSNALAYNYHDRLKSFNNSHSNSNSPDFNPNCAPVETAEIEVETATTPAAARDSQATSPAETNTATTGGSLNLDEACEERVGEEASLNFEALGIKEVAPASPLMTPKIEPNNFLLLQKPIVLSKEGIVGLFSYPKRPVITQDALVINMRTYEKTHGNDYKQCLQMLGHWPDIQALLNNYEDNGEKGLTPATLGIIKINNMLNAHHYWSDPLNISTTFFSLYNYCKDLDSGLIAPIYHHGIDVLKQLYVLSINSPSTLWCSPEHMLTYKQVTKHPTKNSNNGQAIFANSNLYPSHTQAASAPVPVNSTAETNFKAQPTSKTMAQLKAQAMSQTMAHAKAQAQAQAQGNVPSSSSGSIFYQGKGQELAPSYGKELAPTVESELELGHGYGYSYGYKRDQSQVPSQEQALREEQHYESLLDDTNSENNYYGLRAQQHPNTANHQGLNHGYNSRPSSNSKQGSSNLLGQEHYQEQGNLSGNSHGYSQNQSQDFAQGQDLGQSQGQGLGWENSKEMECDKSLGMDYRQEHEGHSTDAMMGTIPYEQSKQESIELLGRTFNNSEDAKQALDQALGLSTAYDKHSYSTNHISYQTNALNGVKSFAKAAYTPTDLNEALDKQLIFNDLSYELMLPVYESLTEYQQAILESCQPWLLNKKLLSYDKERAFASILQNLTKLIKLKVLSPKEAYALAHGQRPKLLKEQDIVAFAIIGQIVKQAHESHQGKFTKEQAHDLKLLKQALYYAKWPLLEQCIDPNFAYRYSKIRLKYGYQGQIINPLSFITDTLEPQPQIHLSHSPSPSSNTSNSNNYVYSHGHGLSSSNNIAQSTDQGLSTGTSTNHKLSSAHKLSTRAKSNLGLRGESEAMGHAHSQQHKQPEQQMQQYGNALAINRNQIVNEYCQEDSAQVINEVINTAQNLRSLYQDLKTLEHGDILNSAQTIINAANRVGNNLPLNKSSTNTLSSVPNQSSITDSNQVFATAPAPGPGLATAPDSSLGMATGESGGLATGSGSSAGSGLNFNSSQQQVGNYNLGK